MLTCFNAILLCLHEGRGDLTIIGGIFVQPYQPPPWALKRVFEYLVGNWERWLLSPALVVGGGGEGLEDSLYRCLSVRPCGMPSISKKSCLFRVFTWEHLGLAGGLRAAEGGTAMGLDCGISRTHYQISFFRDEKRLDYIVIRLLLSLSSLSRALALRSENLSLLVCEWWGLSGRQQTWPRHPRGPHLIPPPLSKLGTSGHTSIIS